MKKTISFIALIVCCLSVAVTGSTAFFSAEKQAHNVITTGKIDIELTELSAADGDGRPVPFCSVFGVMPGMSVSKIVQVKNTGSADAFVRLRVEKSLTLETKEAGDAAVMEIDFNTADWLYGEDGYWYYKIPLKAGETTAPLFSEVLFDKEAGNLYQNARAAISIAAHAVQAANNGASPETAAGWPEAQGGNAQ